jgi:hypothetical protein
MVVDRSQIKPTSWPAGFDNPTLPRAPTLTARAMFSLRRGNTHSVPGRLAHA